MLFRSLRLALDITDQMRRFEVSASKSEESPESLAGTLADIGKVTKVLVEEGLKNAGIDKHYPRSSAGGGRGRSPGHQYFMAKTAPTNKNILIVAGDPSGDLHAADLIKALRAKDPEISVAAIGGVRMQEVSTHFIYNLVSVGAVGFAEPFKNFFLWLKLIKLVRRYMEEKKPACVIAVDFYGFNSQVLGLAFHRKIPAFYYVSPQVWASRPGRAAKIARLTREIFVIFPFEEDLYREVKGNATFVGHPLLDLMPEPADKSVTPADGAWKIGILPGSRKSEIARPLPLFLKAFYAIKEQHPNARA